MAEQRKLIELLLDQAEEHAIVFLDVEGRIVEWSAGASKVYGYDREEVIGKSAGMIFTTEDQERKLFEHEMSVARAGGNMEDDRWMLRKDGQRIWVTGLIRAFRDERGAVIGFSKIMRNRTDLKIRTEALEVEIDSLKTRLERNHKVFAVLAHELRNPLAPIMNAVQLLQLQLCDDANLKPVLDVLESQGKTLSKLILDLVDVTRVTQGKVHCEKVRVNLLQILREVAESCRPETELRQQNLQVLLPPKPIVVLGDPMRLQQIFVNLLSNAIKYTPDGGKIFVRATSDNDAIVTVEDNGIGISPEVLPLVFELFTQEDDPERRTRSGLGIGLALVKDLVTLHSGTVQARSDGKNKGSIFTVQLPLAEK